MFCVSLYQVMAAAVLFEAGVDEVTHNPVPHITLFTYTVALQTRRQIKEFTTICTVKQLIS